MVPGHLLVPGHGEQGLQVARSTGTDAIRLNTLKEDEKKSYFLAAARREGRPKIFFFIKKNIRNDLKRIKKKRKLYIYFFREVMTTDFSPYF